MRAGVLVAVVLVFSGCWSRGPKPVSFKAQIQPILNDRCVKCHGGEKPAGNIIMKSYEDLMNSRSVSSKSPLAFAGRPFDSRIYIVTESNLPNFRMPPDTSGLQPLSADQLNLLRLWIAEGAEDN
jgi:hypothetical protein